MNSQFFQEIYRYNFASNCQVWSAAMMLNDEQFTRKMSYSIGSVQDQFVHMMSVEHWWLYYLKTGELAFMQEKSWSGRAAIRQQWDTTEEMILAYLDTLSDSDLQREVHPDFWDDDIQPVRVYQALYQVVNHSTDHRAQILSLLHQLDTEGIEQDYLFYLWNLPHPSSG